MKKVGYLGPEGTFSEEAALRYLAGGEGGITVPYPSLDRLFEAVSRGELEEAVVPLENSCEGSVNITMDLLAEDFDLKIRGEIIVPVCQSLLVRPGTDEADLEGIVSHPQALGQCRNVIQKKFPALPLLEVGSTAEAARQVAGAKERWGAIGTVRAAESYGLEVLRTQINDRDDNATRFIVLGKEEKPASPDSKTSVIVSVTDRPGALYRLLKEFALKNINLTRIESRPAKRRLGDYLFYIDFQGHRSDPGIALVLNNVAAQAAGFKILGSYPADALYQDEARANRVESMTIEEIRADIDIIDFQIVELLGKRTELVGYLAGLKKGTKIRDADRERKVLDRVKEIAVQKGFDTAVVEEIYKILFRHFVELQGAKMMS
ncbi:MAG: prephenate dehydratase [Firmicutes bacterium]|nr:prephenate dehydratase [Bacillota bacterium]